MQSRLLTAGLAALLCVAVSGSALADATVSPGKAAAYTSVSGLSLGTTFAPAAAVQILKGKKKRALEIEVTVIDSLYVSHTIGSRVFVNGLAVTEPTAAQFEHGCTSSFINCTAQAVYWLDIDAAEAANPGMFVNMPLNISVEAQVDVATTGVVSVRSRLVKK